MRTHVKFTRVNEKEPMYERPRVNVTESRDDRKTDLIFLLSMVKVERGSAFRFKRDLARESEFFVTLGPS